MILYLPDFSLDAQAIAFGESVRNTFYAASDNWQLHTYINYAHGDETKQQLYGYDPWRLPKLQQLKQTYDPRNRFRWFAPVI